MKKAQTLTWTEGVSDKGVSDKGVAKKGVAKKGVALQGLKQMCKITQNTFLSGTSKEPIKNPPRTCQEPASNPSGTHQEPARNPSAELSEQQLGGVQDG